MTSVRSLTSKTQTQLVGLLKLFYALPRLQILSTPRGGGATHDLKSPVFSQTGYLPSVSPRFT